MESNTSQVKMVLTFDPARINRSDWLNDEDDEDVLDLVTAPLADEGSLAGSEIFASPYAFSPIERTYPRASCVCVSNKGSSTDCSTMTGKGRGGGE